MPHRFHGATSLLLAYSLFIVYATTIPFQFVGDSSEAIARLTRVQTSAFASPDGGRPSTSDMLQNVILFVPFGALAMAAASRVGQRRMARVASVALVTALGAALSAGVEVLQLFTVERTSSLNDVATNTFGTAVGAFVMPVAFGAARRVEAAMGSHVREAATYPLMTATALLMIAAWHPFDVELSVSSVLLKLRALLSDPVQRGGVGDEGVDAVRYALFAAAATVFLRRTGRSRALIAGGVAGIALAFVLEASQLFVASRSPGLKDVAVGAAGALLGATIAGSASFTWRRSVIAALIVTSSAVASGLMMLAPFTIAPSWTHVEWMPFLGYYRYTSGQDVSHVFELALAFFPIGFAIAGIAKPRARWAWTLAAAMPLACVLEYLQGWVVGRYPDVTDIGVLVLGAIAGAWTGGPGWEKFAARVL